MPNYAVDMYGPDFDGAVGQFVRERVTSCFPTIDSDHAFIHEGVAYTASTGFLTVANNATCSLSVLVPADAYVHWKPAIVTGSATGLITLHESATVSGTSAAVTPRNRNRLSGTDTSVTTCASRAAATITPSIELDHAVLPGGGTGATRIGGNVTAAAEWVAKQSTLYTISVLNNSGGSATYAISAFWYEESGA